MYGDKTESTLCCSVVKAVLALCNCMNGTGEGAVGQIDTNKSVAEYKSSESPDTYHLVVFDAATGSVLASVYVRTRRRPRSMWCIRVSGTERRFF